MKNSDLNRPDIIEDSSRRYDSFANDDVLHGKKKNHLPAMGWNSWNAFGSANTEMLTKDMADCIVKLGLDKLGYKYLVLDDGCYLSERIDGKLANDTEKFPSGFKALSDYIHSKGLKFGMYNDIGTNLCAGAAVGTCGHEKEDAGSYVSWGVDFLKVDNCYYLWDNATFSNAENAKYVFAPAIGEVNVTSSDSFRCNFAPGKNITCVGTGIKTEDIDGKTYFIGIGSTDGTGPAQTPVGPQSGELELVCKVPFSGKYKLDIECICDVVPDKGSWLQIGIVNQEANDVVFDDFVTPSLTHSDSLKSYATVFSFVVDLIAGENRIRLMNHRRQENTLASYAKLLEGLKEADPDNDIIYSLCEWGKTNPQNWGKKVGDSWRILNDITFCVGSPTDYGKADWISDYTTSVTSQYNKCVIMDEYAGLSKGWNDPDMMMIGMNNINLTQMKTHFAMWCMMNSPLMLGFDLRRVEKGDELYNIIANEELIALNQDELGIQAKRVYSSIIDKDFDITYITNNDRVDILAKPLADGGIAVSFINLSMEDWKERVSISFEDMISRLVNKSSKSLISSFLNAKEYDVIDLWTGENQVTSDKSIAVDCIEACGNVTVKIIPNN